MRRTEEQSGKKHCFAAGLFCGRRAVVVFVVYKNWTGEQLFQGVKCKPLNYVIFNLKFVGIHCLKRTCTQSSVKDCRGSR